MKARKPTFIAAIFAGAVFSLGLMGCPSSGGDDPVTPQDITTPMVAPAQGHSEANYALKIPVTGGKYTSGAKLVSNWALDGSSGSSRAAVAPTLVTLSEDNKDAYLSGPAIVPGVTVTKIKAAAITAGAKPGTPAWAAPPSASTGTTDLKSAPFTSTVGDTVLTITLKDGTFVAAAPLLSDFEITGTAGFALDGGIVTRDSTNPSVAAITGLTPVSIAGTGQTLTIKPAAVSLGTTIITSVVAGAPADIESSAFTSKVGDAVLTITLTGGTFLSPLPSINTFSISPVTDGFLKLDGGVITRDEANPARVVITGLTEVDTAGNNQRIKIPKAAITVGTSAASVAATKPITVSDAAYDASTGILTINGDDFTGSVFFDKITLGNGSTPLVLSSANTTASSVTAAKVSITLNAAGKTAFKTAGDGLDMNGSHHNALKLEAGWLTGAPPFGTGAAGLSIVVTGYGGGQAVAGADYDACSGDLVIYGSGVPGFPTSATVDVTKFKLKNVPLTNASHGTVTNAATITITVGGIDKTAVNTALSSLGNGTVTGGLDLEADYVPGGAADACDVIVGGYTDPLADGTGEVFGGAQPKLKGTVIGANVSAGAALTALDATGKTGFSVLLTKAAAQAITPRAAITGSLTAARITTTAISSGTAVEIPVELDNGDFDEGDVIFDIEVSELGKETMTYTVTVTFTVP